MPTGMKESAYRPIFAQFSFLCIIRRMVAPNATIKSVTERNINVKPSISLLGREFLKSRNRYEDVTIERNVTTDVKEKLREIASATAKTINNG